MKIGTKLCGFILPLLFLSITLLGISYSGWVNENKIISLVSTASMDYNFTYNWNKVMLIHADGTIEPLDDATISVDDNKVLKVEFPDGGLLLSLTCDRDTIQIPYTIEKVDSRQIQMKQVDGQYLGDFIIQLDPNSVECNYKGTELPSYYHLIPDNLGTYYVYFTYNGTDGGTIDLIPKQLPVVEPVIINEEDLPITVNTIMASDTSKQEREDQKDNDDKKNEDQESDSETLVLRGKYHFTIPLNFDQYNAIR